MTRVFSKDPERDIIEGETALLRGEFRAAEDHFLSVARLPRGGGALFHLANFAMSHGSLDFAEAMLRRALKEDTADAGVWNNLGVVLVRSGRAHEASDAFASAVSLAPDYRDAADNLERIAHGESGGWKLTRTRLKRDSKQFASAA